MAENETGILKKLKDNLAVNRKISQLLTMIFILLAAVLITSGVVGNDIFSPIKPNENKHVVESTHILRNERETHLKFRLNKFEGVTQITFPENYLAHFNVNLIYPTPQHKQYINGNIIYTYNADDNEMVTFYIEPRKTGRIKGSLLVGDQSHTISHLVYP
ncbi:MAG: hypothetical protein H0V30_05190 [Chitinophagaceae bacterium]|jgi:hypothetical protein|nr:hypothetical protein [Chitinophagaceae bacterium]